jgi:glyceraldehyde-3-phosphate dehydrogenase type II
MIVLVNGLGNIGTTLANVLHHYQEALGITEIWVSKRTIRPWLKPELEMLASRDINICSDNDHENYPSIEEILEKVNYVFEATSNGVGLSNKRKYERLANIIGCSAQGSEKGFGISYMSGVNDHAIYGEKFVHVVSCNTHGSAALLRTFAGKDLENLHKADMVVVRRSEDLGNHERLVSANVVARHLDDVAGTHHSVDVIDLFDTIGIPCNLTSSDVTTPSQLMHAVRFNIELKHSLALEIDDLIELDYLISYTNKFDSNVVFELGRRYGFQGRIFSHAIILKNNILMTEYSVKGWAFVPQEGNSIISTLHAYLLQTKHPEGQALIDQIVLDLCRKEW